MPIMRLVLLFVMMAISVAHAGGASDFVKGKETQAIKLLQKSADEKRFDAVVDELFDYDAITQGTLKSSSEDLWTPRSDAEKKELTDLVKQSIRISYRKHMKKQVDREIEYVEKPDKAGFVMVRSESSGKKDVRSPQIVVAYKLTRKSGAWRAEDILTEGSSFVTNHRDAFFHTIKTDGFAKVLIKLKANIAKRD
jgi:phospholipid transport system substrate-binding protein